MYSGMLAFCCFLSSWANLSKKNINFLNHYPCLQSWHGVFQFGTFLNVTLSESRCMSASGLSSIVVFLFWYFSNRLFFFCSHVLLNFFFIFFVPGCWFVFLYSPLSVVFSFVILEGPVSFLVFLSPLLLDSIPVTFYSPVDRQCLLIYLYKLYCLSCFVVIFRSFHSFVYFSFFSTFAKFHSFCICLSSFISHRSLIFQFGLFYCHFD